MSSFLSTFLTPILNRNNLLNIGVSTAILIVVFLIKGPSNKGDNFLDVAGAVLTGQDVNQVRWQNETLEKELERIGLTDSNPSKKKPYKEAINAHVHDTNSLREFFSEALVEQIESSDLKRGRVIFKDLIEEYAPHIVEQKDVNSSTYDYDEEKVALVFSGSSASIESKVQGQVQGQTLSQRLHRETNRRTFWAIQLYRGQERSSREIHHSFNDVAMRFSIRKEKDDPQSIYNPLGFWFWRDPDLRFDFHLTDGSREQRTRRDKIIFSNDGRGREDIIDEFRFSQTPSIRSDNFYEIEILMIKNKIWLFSEGKLLTIFNAQDRYDPEEHSGTELLGGADYLRIITNGYQSKYTLKDFSIVSLK